MLGPEQEDAGVPRDKPQVLPWARGSSTYLLDISPRLTSDVLGVALLWARGHHAEVAVG